MNTSPHWKASLNDTIAERRRERAEERRKEAISLGEVITEYLERIPLDAEPVKPKPLPTVEQRVNFLKRDYHAVAFRRYPNYDYEPIREQLNTIVNYFVGVGDLPFDKGLLLAGAPGAGKTEIMKIFAEVLSHGPTRPGGMQVRENMLGFVVKPATELCTDYASRQGEAIGEFVRQYGRKLTGTGGIPYNHLCIDDIFKEEMERAYSYGKNPVKQILNDRYNIRRHGVVTHATTNYELADMVEGYGAALVDRLRELFFIIEFHNQSFRG